MVDSHTIEMLRDILSGLRDENQKQNEIIREQNRVIREQDKIINEVEKRLTQKIEDESKKLTAEKKTRSNEDQKLLGVIQSYAGTQRTHRKEINKLKRTVDDHEKRLPNDREIQAAKEEKTDLKKDVKFSADFARKAKWTLVILGIIGSGIWTVAKVVVPWVLKKYGVTS